MLLIITFIAAFVRENGVDACVRDEQEDYLYTLHYEMLSIM